MYQQQSTSSSFMTYMHNPLPSPEYTGDSDSECEVAKELAQRRRQLDEEVARFQAQKDKEFAQFEVELKARKRQAKLAKARSRYSNNTTNYEIIRRSPSSTPPTSSVSDINEKRTNFPPISPASKATEPIYLIGSSSGPKSTAPTVCLDRLNIAGRTQPLASHDSENPGTYSAFVGSKRPVSPTSKASAQDIVIAEQYNRDGKSFASESRPDFTFTGKQFSFLPLLGSRNDMPDEAIIDGTQTEPASPADTDMMENIGLRSSSMPTESSISNTFKVPPTKRAYTSPSTAHRRALAPIICNVNGRKRSPGKRKRVTFQLADRAIVQPSSSYEEAQSTNSTSTRRGSDDSESPSSVAEDEAQDGDSKRPSIKRKQTPMDVFGRRRAKQSNIETPDEDIGKSMAELLLGDGSEDEPDRNEDDHAVNRNKGYFALRKGPSFEDPASSQHSESTAPVLNQDEAKSHTGNDQTTPGGYRPRRRPTSPQFQPPFHRKGKYHPGSLEDIGPTEDHSIGFFELDEEMSTAQAEKLQPTDELVDESLDTQLERHDAQAVPDTYRTGTSVPIDILKPSSVTISSTWIGTFGH